MLEFMLIHVLVFADWWVKPQINHYTKTHYVAYPMFLWLLFYYGVFGILLAGINIKNAKRTLPLYVWYLFLFGDMVLVISRFVYQGTAEAMLILLMGMSGTIVVSQKLFEKRHAKESKEE